MPLLIRERETQEQLLAERRARGLDRWDEVWDGVYVMPPLPNDQHQEIQGALVTAFQIAIKWPGLGEVRPGVNVSDRKVDWRENFRCPDVTVFLNGTRAQNCGAFWFGGPDFAVEIVSPDDSSRDKLDFYAKVGVRELLVIDRLPWQLELYRLDPANNRLVDVGRSVPPAADALRSEVVPLSFRLLPGGARPTIDIAHHDGNQRWTA
jgi:Uma2 family endonuclease